MEELAISRRLTDNKVHLAAKSTRSRHPYLSGNYWPQRNELHLSPCEVIGSIPQSLAGGQFVRNGPNSSIPPEDGQNYHMFDGDGMIHGVYFKSIPGKDELESLYINRFVHTDVYLASQYWGTSLLPSIASLIDPLTNTVQVLKSILRSGAIAFLSGSARLSTANTALVYHDNRLLATCESGPPMHIGLPELETVDWHTFTDERTGVSLAPIPGSSKEWITGHPKVDPVSGELLMFGYDIFQLFNPHIRFSVIDADGSHKNFQQPVYLKSKTPKMMHDFAITQTRAVILDLPLTMSPFNIVGGGKPMLHFDISLTSKFGVLPRTYDAKRDRDQVVWFESDSCMIFHTVNAWDDHDSAGNVVGVNLVACRFKGAKLVFAAGAIQMPSAENLPSDVVHLYYYRFDLNSGKISHEYPLSDYPIEYPSINTRHLSLPNRYAYGASMREGSFDTALSGAKVDVLVKCDIQALIRSPPTNVTQSSSVTPPSGAHVKTILLPPGLYASEATFVPNTSETATGKEDDGYILVHIFDESTRDPVTKDALDDKGSEVWIISAESFSLPPICKVRLPQRVPYGLHGLWVTKSQIESQRDAKRNSEGDIVAAKASREHTSVRIITNFWKWSLVWAGRSTVGGLSSGRYAASLFIGWTVFILLTYRLFGFIVQHTMQSLSR
ncbi:Putative uncharacterized protein [Taphrina deformans PYCC 5710]|uniref:Carotenoid oxygenase n=1 Tax=Taphrina deformans (strain PYCC 5710 / ATCC 11124 / CBS 356.35 / IMI 108563 / JCM 9778 / NBRC 8474) TaxID=1097556 RepID=R4XBG0_TAPDE|nr:Putative uncharacterized protein [Taphrina deformans PYCC 5710]|eukprot:CCG82935.1 Putative uncharacterized protein [Taphrina deformans PYCC 5710]